MPEQPIKGRCSQCGRAFSAPSHLAGKRLRCPACQEVLKLPGKQVVVQRPVSADDDKPPAGESHEEIEAPITAEPIPGRPPPHRRGSDMGKDSVVAPRPRSSAAEVAAVVLVAAALIAVIWLGVRIGEAQVAIQADLTAVRKALRSVDFDVSSIKSDVSAIKSDVGSPFSSIKSDVSSIQSDVSSIKSDVSSIQLHVSFKR